ncbi:ATP-binding protein [Desulfogranum mediterraneum]|uniref:ATP-binding protein n=1 Tax=Desulfogranum mediterraneum TaxID=160661 RepID=UPI000410EAC2|nr:transporter substrate-binding domain-containing protein [Desulfogranum mediterraneum]
MIRTVGRLLFFLLFFSSISSAREVIRVGVYEYPPLLFQGEQDRPQGLFIDLIEEIARRERWQVRYVHESWASLLKMLEQGELDILPAIAYSKERARRFTYTYESVVTNWAELFTAKSTSLTSLLELDGLKIGVAQGDIHFAALQDITSKLALDCRFIEVEDYLTIMEMLDAGYVQVGVVSRLFGVQYQSQFQVRETPVLFNPVELRFAGPKGDPYGWVSAIDRHLTAMQREEGSAYFTATNRWLKVEDRSQLPRYLLLIIAAIGAVALFFFVTAFILRLKIKERTRALMAANQQLTREVGERLEIEHELRKLAEIVSASTDAMALLDREGVHQVVNGAYMVLAREAGLIEVKGSHFSSLFGGTTFCQEMEAAFKQCLGGEVVQQKRDFLGQGGETTIWHLTYSPSCLAVDDQVSGVVLDIRDVSEQIRLEESLKNAQKMEALGMLAGGVAHDLNNILSGLVGYPDMLLSNLAEDSKFYQPLMVIKRSGERAAAVVADLLTLARRGVDNHEPLDFNQVLRDFLDSPEHQQMVQGRQHIRYKINISAEPCMIMGSSIQLSKVIMNLVVNALEAMPDGGRLLLETRHQSIEPFTASTGQVPKGPYVVFTVQDNGVGIAANNVSSIFEPFYTSKVMGSSGTGLGMTIVYGIVKDHGGSIDLASTRFQGTTFRLFLPLTEQAALEEEEEEGLDLLSGANERILVVDDMREQREIATDMLRNLGYSAHAVASGEDCLDYLRSHAVDLVILDMIMPGGLDGLSTYQEIVRLNSSQKSIIASGFSRSDHVYKAQRLGAGLYLKKPYTMLELAKAVRASL